MPLKALCTLAGTAVQPGPAEISVCKLQLAGLRQMNKNMTLFFSRLCFSRAITANYLVDAIEHVTRQIFRMALISIHRILWIKAWTAEVACKRATNAYAFPIKTYFW